MSTDSILLDSTFKVTQYSQKKYDRVARISGENGNLTFTLDINCEIYQVSEGDTVQMALATTLSLDGQESKGDSSGWRETRTGEATLADSYDYVCYGKVYRFDESEDGNNVKVYISFGGLLLFLDGPHKKLSSLKQEYVYMLMKK